MEFSCSTFLGLGVQFDRQAGGYSSGFLGLDRESMLRIHRETIPVELYAAIATFADAAKCTGGRGDFAISLDAIPPDAMLTDVLAAPLNRELWHSIFVLPKTRVTSTSLLSTWASKFEQLDQGRFMFFINREFLDFCRFPKSAS